MNFALSSLHPIPISQKCLAPRLSDYTLESIYDPRSQRLGAKGALNLNPAEQLFVPVPKSHGLFPYPGDSTLSHGRALYVATGNRERST
jgi:hypothetical protein